MLEVANFEHARFGVLSKCYSFRHFTATDPSFGWWCILNFHRQQKTLNKLLV